MNNQGFNLVELLVAVACSVLLFTGVYGFFNAANQSYSSGISGQTLQDGADIVLSRILGGQTESGTVYRLPTSKSFAVACTSNCDPNPVVLYSCGGIPQNASCNANDPYNELYFCQDNPPTNCDYNDPTASWYYLDITGTKVMYHYPGEPNNQDIMIYQAPSPLQTTLTLRFSPAQKTNPSPPPATLTIPNVVEIDVALRENLAAANVITNNRLSATSGSGAASTFVLLRDHQ